SSPRPRRSAARASCSATTGRGRAPASPISTRSRSTWPPGWWRSVPRLPRRPAWRRRERDVAIPPSPAAGREPRILATRGAPMPFSKGRMAQALVLAGADPERAYQIAMRIEREVKATPAEEIPIDQLHGMVEDILVYEEGFDFVFCYYGWCEVLRFDRSLMFLIGGVMGMGKSMIVIEIVYCFGISR